MIGLREDCGGETAEAPELPSMDRIFGESGWLADTLGLEHRPEQGAMAAAVAEALAEGDALFAEAGTGVGKSLAYLVPGILRAVAEKRPFIVSTHTIALQEQILKKDLELCRRLFAAVPELAPFAEFRTALMVGRGNYLCGTRLAQAIETRSELFKTAQQADLERVAEWSVTTETGLFHEISPEPDREVWEWVNAEGSACNPRNCSPDTCPYRRARKKMQEAHVVIVNHSLLFALLGAGMQPKGKTPGVLLPNDFLVLDEAHTVAAVATGHFGHRVSSYGVRRTLLRLCNPERKKNRGLLDKIGHRGDAVLVQRALDGARQFFDAVAAEYLRKRTVVRVNEEDWADPVFEEPFAALLKRLGDRIAQLDEGPLRDEATGLRQLLSGYVAAMRECLTLSSPDDVYWIEKSGRRQTIVTLRSAPIDVAPVLREALYGRGTSVVMTSATLADSPGLERFMATVGADEGRTLQVQSPFDFEHNTCVFAASDMPPPTRENARLDVEYLADMTGYCALACGGGTLVLFTSYADMNSVADATGPRFAAAGRPFLVQGRDGSRTDLIQRMRAAGNAILFGTDSFWTGVDVAGDALAQVIVTRLPFENPTEPVAEAKAERCVAEGRNAFAEVMLPNAVMKFRQGIGRLIRTKIDRGTITILDSRVLHKSYGKRFLDMLPVPRWTPITRRNREALFKPVV
ncbi:MAG: ATP-dependent DNA helicase [Opitutales bacterium]|nr:ATP-dependent DNA helicase [Opitutales bacterium]